MFQEMKQLGQLGSYVHWCMHVHIPSCNLSSKSNTINLRHAVGPVGEMQHQPRRLVLLAVGIAFGLQLRGFNFLELQIAQSENVKISQSSGEDVHQSVSKRSRSMFIALVSVSPLSASAQSEDFQIDPTLIFAIVLVFGSIAAGLSWVASLKPKKFGDGQPRSTSLYRVFQARMRAGEFAALAEAEKAEKEKKQGQPGEEDAELDAFVDAYVDALEEDSEPEKQKVDLEDGEGSSALKPTDKKWSLSDRRWPEWFKPTFVGVFIHILARGLLQSNNEVKNAVLTVLICFDLYFLRRSNLTWLQTGCSASWQL